MTTIILLTIIFGCGFVTGAVFWSSTHKQQVTYEIRKKESAARYNKPPVYRNSNNRHLKLVK